MPSAGAAARTNANNIKYDAVGVLLLAMATGCPLTWRNGYGGIIPRDMSLICPGLAAIPAFAAIAAVLSRTLASLAHEVRLTAVAWLALRGTQPSERPEILRALAAAPQQMGWTTISKGDSINETAKHQGNRRSRAQRLSSRKNGARCLYARRSKSLCGSFAFSTLGHRPAHLLAVNGH